MEKVPVLVCLTFADKLYAEHMSDDGKHPEKEAMKFQLQQELMVSLSGTPRGVGQVSKKFQLGYIMLVFPRNQGSSVVSLWEFVQ